MAILFVLQRQLLLIVYQIFFHRIFCIGSLYLYTVKYIFQEQDQMFTILAGVLTMGNIAIATNDNNDATIDDQNGPLQTVAVCIP